MINPGLIALSSSYPRPHFSIVPGLKFSIRKSVCFTSSRTMFCPSAFRRLAVMQRLFRAHTDHQSGKPSRPQPRSGSPCPGGSILMTSAPMSANICPQNGPATSCPSSSTRRSVSGPCRAELVSVISVSLSVVSTESEVGFSFLKKRFTAFSKILIFKTVQKDI